MEQLRFATVEEIYENYLSMINPIDQVIDVPTQESIKSVVFSDVVAEEDLPGFDKSLVDGYAVNSRDTKGASPIMPVVLDFAFEVRIGDKPPASLRPNEAAWVPTGAMIPEGADAVVMVENTQRFGKIVEIMKSTAPGENVMKAQEDVHKGQIVIHKGTRIKLKHLSLLFSLGVQKLSVYRKPKVAIVSTGDEIVEPFVKQKQLTEVRDSNSYTLASWLRNHYGLQAQRVAHVKDDEIFLKEILVQCIEEYDAIVISGGSSIGVRDITAKVIQSLGSPGLIYHGALIQPGKPTIFGLIDDKPILGLPGNPVSFVVSTYVFLLPVLRKLEGEATYLPVPCGTVRISKNVPSVQGREHFVRVKLSYENGEIIAEPLFSESSSLSNLAMADGLIRIRRGVEGVYAGEHVELYNLWE